MVRFAIFCLVLAMVAAGCKLVPSTGDTASDAAAAQNFLPASIAGYNVTEATSVIDAISKTGAAGALITGNAALTLAISRIDSMIQCYNGVGAVSARVYTEQNITATGIPKIGALAVINSTRLGRNFVQCAINTGGVNAQSAGTVEPCGGSGSFVVNNENLEYVYGATTPELCSIFQAQFNGR